MCFEKIESNDFLFNPFKRIGRDWMLVTAGSREMGVNTLTACWGGLGNLWHKDAAFIFIRPSRYTYEFIEANETFSLCFFPTEKAYKKMLAYMGSHSGRDGDKISDQNLHVTYIGDTPVFTEAEIALTCRREYFLDFVGERIPGNEIKRFYSGEDEGDFHRFYAAEVTGIYRKKED